MHKRASGVFKLYGHQSIKILLFFKESVLLKKTLKLMAQMNRKIQTRSIEIPKEKIGLLKNEWFKIYAPIVEVCKLQIRMNLRTGSVDLRTCEETEDMSSLDKAIMFIKSVILGFQIHDAIINMQYNDIYLVSFDICEVKILRGDHLSRAVGRIVGKDGKTKFAIESVSKAKIVIKDSKVHILGSRENVDVAKDSICRLIMGSEPSKIHNRLRSISAKLKEKHSQIETIYHNEHMGA